MDKSDGGQTAQHTGERPHRCGWPGCEYAAARAHHLTRHRLTHTGERPHRCGWPGCEYAAAQAQHLASHRLTHTRERETRAEAKSLTRHREVACALDRIVAEVIMSTAREAWLEREGRERARRERETEVAGVLGRIVKDVEREHKGKRRIETEQREHKGKRRIERQPADSATAWEETTNSADWTRDRSDCLRADPQIHGIHSAAFPESTTCADGWEIITEVSTSPLIVQAKRAQVSLSLSLSVCLSAHSLACSHVGSWPFDRRFLAF